jgi:type III HopA1-like effector protein
VSRYRDQVADALGAVAIRGPLRYAWLGRCSRGPRAALRDEFDAPARRDYLLGCLREELYWSFYCRGGVVPARWGELGPVSVDPLLAREIAAANAGRGGWQAGWTVERMDAEGVLVTSGRLRARLPVAACRAEHGAVEARAAVSVPMPAQVPALSPGYWTLLGQTGDEIEGGVLRVYWHITRRGVPAFVRALTAGLNRQTVPFRLKVADHPLRFDRCDAAVLYLRPDDFAELRPLLASLALELASRLRPREPAFTLALAPGVGLAEDHGTGESFGARRCALLAEGILDAHERRASRLISRVEAVVARFERAGLEIDAPYLDPALAGRHVL